MSTLTCCLDFVKLFEKPDPTGGPIPLIKTQAEMPCSARELYDLVNNASVEERKAWEKSLLNAELIESMCLCSYIPLCFTGVTY